ncbi:MAG: 30S ribosomal protein S1 [Proteobacteria bacterium]|nr:30S ribosomal protein S1 [Pseudomonadota bacterium]
MSDQEQDDLTEGEGPSFADLLDEYSPNVKDHLQVGDKIKGRIISISKETVFIDTGSKIDGAIDIKELLDAEGALPFKPGDKLDLYVMAVDESEVVLSKAVSGAGGAAILKDAYRSAIPVEGKVTGPCKGGFNVEIIKRRAFCPMSQMDIAFVENQENYTGKTFPFLIIQYEENGKNIVVSRRKLLEMEVDVQRKEFLKGLTTGSILDGKITRIMPYGAFVQIGPGVEGMAHISELSWSKIQKPEEVLSKGEQVKALVLDIKPQEKGQKAPKISLSIKQLFQDPWHTIGDQFKAGEKVTGKVTRCMPFGAFVEIAPGIEGLVHISEMSYTRRILKAEDVVKPGEEVSVVIKEIDAAHRKIALSLKDADGDPWADVLNHLKPGQSVTGIIEQKADFGLFVQLSAGIVGLLPKSSINRPPDAQSIEKLKQGDSVTVLIENVDTATRKISLTPSSSAEETQWKEYSADSGNSMGALGEKLQSAFNQKKDK